MSDDFKKYWDKAKLICTIESILSAKDKNWIKYQHELIEPPHQSWKVDGDSETWSPPLPKQFTCFSGDATPAASRAVKYHLKKVSDPYDALAELFQFFIYYNILEYI